MISKTLHILIPTDFSDNASSALNYALKLYSKEQCTFYVLHSTYIDEAVTRAFTAAYRDETPNTIVEGKLSEFLVKTEAANANAKHNFKPLLTEEELRIAVKNAVKHNSIDMVVMGTKGTTDAVEYLMGSNTVKVIRKIGDCPVLILPDGYSFVEPVQIAFPTDFNRNYEVKELESLKDLADLYHSKIRIVHVNVNSTLTDKQEENMNILKKYLANYEHSFHWLTDSNTKAIAIATFIDEFKIDMLAMINYKHGLLEAILKEPVIKTLAFHPIIPILVIPK